MLSSFRYRGPLGRPLADTLLGDHTAPFLNPKNAPTKPWELNRYLSDDRVICYEVVNKADSHWHLDYDRSAVAETDIPMDTTNFIMQRRRWLNGSFSTIYIIKHWRLIHQSAHNTVSNPNCFRYSHWQS